MVNRKIYRNQRKNKRWYIDASLPKSVPFVGGSSFRAGSGNRRSIQAVVKRQALKSEETKKQVFSPTNLSAYHGTLYTTQLNNIPQGTNIGSRSGDAVYYCGINLKFQIYSPLPNSLWRLFVVQHRDSFPGVSGVWGTGIGASQLFRNSDISPWSMTNNDDVKILCKKTFKMDQQFSGETINRIGFMNCKLMKKFQFRSGQQTEGEYYNYYLVILPYSEGAAPVINGTLVGSIGLTVEQVFKDA